MWQNGHEPETDDTRRARAHEFEAMHSPRDKLLARKQPNDETESMNDDEIT